MINFRRELLKASIPLTKMIGKAHAPFSHKRVTARDYRALKNHLQLGDVLLTRIRGELSNVFIKSHLTHGALYIKDDLILEAKGDGVVEADPIDFCLTKDEIEVVRYWRPITDQRKFALIALSLRGTPYDYLFETDFKKTLDNQSGKTGCPSLYCTEFVAAVYFLYFGFYFDFTPRDHLGSSTYMPDDFLAAERKWQRVLSLPINGTLNLQANLP